MSNEYARYWNDFVGDPLVKVGGSAELEAMLQEQFCLSAGLRADYHFLDYGCGCLRGTLGLVKKLAFGHFHGCDVSEKLIAAGRERASGLLVDLRVIDGFDLRGLFRRKFDFILSVSLMTHILGEDLEKCLSGVRGALKAKGRWFFTIYPLSEEHPDNFRGDIGVMFYKRSYLREVGERCGLEIEDYGTELRPNPVPGNQFLEKVNSTLGQWVMIARVK